MLKIIKKTIRGVLRNEGVKEPVLSNILLDAPINVLLEIEAAGMSPPPYYTREDIELSMKYPKIFLEQQNFGYEGVRRWEPEDEPESVD